MRWLEAFSARVRRGTLVSGLAALVVACAPTETEAPLRSPTRDYPPPPPREPDGRVMGADNLSPEERLEQGAQVGRDPKLAPGWKLDEEKRPTFDPKQRKGGAVEPGPAGGTEER